MEEREREEEAQKQREEAMRDETTNSSEEGVAEKCERIKVTQKWIQRVEAGTYQSHSRHKKGHMTNIYLMDSDEEAVVDFVKDHEELFDKTNEYFKDDRKECLGEVLQQPQAVCQGVQDLVQIRKDSLRQAQTVQA